MRYLLLTLLAFNGLSALFGGSLLMAAPDGSLLNMPLSLLAGTPFADFLIPGIILFIILGVGSGIGWSLVYRRSPFATRWVQVVGLGTMVWIVTQVIMIQSVDGLHMLYGATGIALVMLAKKGSLHHG